MASIVKLVFRGAQGELTRGDGMPPEEHDGDDGEKRNTRSTPWGECSANWSTLGRFNWKAEAALMRFE